MQLDFLVGLVANATFFISIAIIPGTEGSRGRMLRRASMENKEHRREYSTDCTKTTVYTCQWTCSVGTLETFTRGCILKVL